METPFQPLGSEPPVATPTEKVGSFRASKMIVYASWNMLKKDSEMLLFPVLSFFASSMAAVALFILYFFTVAGGDTKFFAALGDQETTHAMSTIEYVIFFVYYVVMYFITVYFEAGIVAIAHARIKGHDLTFRDGLRVASAHVGKLFVWALLNATVGLIIRTIAERSKLLGRIVISLLGAMWSILTFFILPVLILEDQGIKESLARSAQTIKKTWGETVIVKVGVGLYMFVLVLLGIAAFIAALVTGSGAVIILATILLVVYLFALILISSTLNTIFKVVLYEYAATGTLPEAFPVEMVRYAFGPKK